MYTSLDWNRLRTDLRYLRATHQDLQQGKLVLTTEQTHKFQQLYGEIMEDLEPAYTHNPGKKIRTIVRKNRNKRGMAGVIQNVSNFLMSL